jgi:hypothetical protein
VFGCSMVVCSGTVVMVRDTGVPSDGGVVVMGIVGVTMFHPQEIGKLKLPPPLEVVSPSSMDSSMIVCSDGNPLRTIPTNTMCESFPSGERLGRPKWSAVNSKLPK